MVPGFFTPYRYKKTRAKRPEAPSFPSFKEDEGLTGTVLGKDASDLEERFARALNTYGVDFVFQFFVETAHSLPYQEKQVDFVVYSGQPEPVEIDGLWVHKTQAQREYDRERDAQVDEALAPHGFAPLRRIRDADAALLATQDGANGVVDTYFA